MPTRSVSKINDETVTAAKLRQVTGLLIDIHGQHEHQSLLHASKHLEILDTFAKSRTRLLKDQVVDAYRQYKALKAELEETAIDLEGRGREMDFLRFEIDEIEAAQLKDGEKESLTEQYRRQANGRKILESLSLAYQAVEMDGIGQALRQVNEVAAYDSQLKGILDQLYDAESILNDIRHAIGVYQEEMAFDEEELLQAEQRLDLIHHMESKYGGTTEQVYKTLEEKKQRLEQLEHYDEYRGKQEERYKQASKRLEELSGKLSKERQKAAADLTGQIRKGLTDLNFLDVSFSMEFRRLDHYTAQGFDEAEFMISTNPGEPGRSLGMVASGGELSRVMLAIKAALADSDAVPTLIFDEIDTGISGRTAQKVSEKLAIISHSHQVICITHLPQIAAMADSHYEIVKSSKGKSTTTRIHLLDGETMVDELARLLGGAEITDAVRQNAREMKKLAEKVKHG